MIQDIAPHRLENQFIPGTKISPEDPVFLLTGQNVLIKQDAQGLALPFRRDFARLGDDDFCFLFRLDGRSCFLCTAQDVQVPEGYELRPVRSLRGYEDEGKYLVFAAYTALQLSGWYLDNRYCGRCGGPTVPAQDERAIDCPACKRRIYPRIVPAVIVGVTNGDELLITRYANRLHAVDALIAGFTEIGETLEETVAREVMEEVGIKVRNIRYYGSQPWAIADDILAGYFCDADGSTQIRLDRSELKEGRWVRREEIKGQPDSYSLTNEMMLAFRDGKEPRS